jgi:hypothetical protein
MESILDTNEIPPIFYKRYSEDFIKCAFHQHSRKLYKLLRESEKRLTKNDYDFELMNALESLEICGEIIVSEWLLTEISYCERNKNMGEDYI